MSGEGAIQLVVSHSYEMVALVTLLEKKCILKMEEIIEEIKMLKYTTN